MYLKALQLLDETQTKRLKSIYLDSDLAMNADLIAEVKDLLAKSYVKVHAEELKLVYQQLAMSHLDALSVDAEKKIPLRELAESLLNRSV